MTSRVILSNNSCIIMVYVATTDSCGSAIESYVKLISGHVKGNVDDAIAQVVQLITCNGKVLGLTRFLIYFSC